MVFRWLPRTALVILCAVLSCACVADKRAASVLRDSLINRIATDGPGIPIVVFNPLSWERTDAVDVESPFPGESPNIRVTDTAGKSYPARTLGDRLFFTARNVPALGYRVFWANRVAKPIPAAIKCTSERIENQFFRVDIDKHHAVITGIYDKVNSRQIVPSGGRAGLLQLRYGGSKARDVSDEGSSVMMDSGPARGMLILDSSHGSYRIVQELILREGVSRVDIHITADWSQPITPGQLPAALCACFPTRLIASEPVKSGIEILENGVAVPGLRWVDLSDGNYGVSLLADRVYACDATKGLLVASVRQQGDPAAPGGAWEACYSLYPHKGDWLAGRVFEHSFEVANPLAARVATKHQGDLPRTYSILSFPNTNVAGVLSPAESPASSPILRFYETNGQYSRVPVKIGMSGIKLTPANQSGKPLPGLRPIIEHSFTFNMADNDSAAYLFEWEKQ